jgi:Pro-kumamolisin, activation domain/Divergent InlB B-repeat domain
VERFAVIGRAGLILATCALALAPAAPSASPSRLAGTRPNAGPTGAGGDALAALVGTRHPLARPERDRGPADGGAIIRGMSLVLGPSPRQQRELTALLAGQRDPSSPDYRGWLTPEQYAERFGPSRAELDEIVGWLERSGFRVESTARSRTRVSFTGSVTQVEAALHAQMRRYSVNGEIHIANGKDVAIPSGLSGIVRSVRNLSDFRPKPRHIRVRTVWPEFTFSRFGRHYLAPEDFATIYGVQPVYRAGFDGLGQKIAVVGQTQIDPGDVAAFRAASGLAPAPLELTLVPGTGASAVSAADLLEAALDVEWSGGVAKGATIVYVYTGGDSNTNVLDALHYAIDENLAPVISISYGLCEQDMGRAETLTLQQWARQANAQGQTISAAAGDAGAADCQGDASASSATGLAVDVPASIPEVTGVGGTEFVGDLVAPGSYWSATNDASGGSATAYIPEAVWNDTALDGALAAGGGGASGIFSKPDWQAGPGVPDDGVRDVPDIALNASADHDGYLICSQGSCANGYLMVVGGTSAGAPAFAAVLALLQQARDLRGLGNVNPVLYDLASRAEDGFHRITAGSNVVPCAPGTPDCPDVPPYQLGYVAGPAYSQAAGLGSLDVGRLVAAWPAAGAATAEALTVTLAGTGAGSVTGGSLNCSSTSTTGCSAGFAVGTTVTLLATPGENSTFGGWGGACRGTGDTCQLTMTAARSVTAAFQAVPAASYPLSATVAGSGAGSVSGGGLRCTGGSAGGCSASVAAGATVTLTATAAGDSEFVGWGGACGGTAGTCQLTATGAKAVTALFQTRGGAGGCGYGAGGASSVLGLALAMLLRRPPRRAPPPG